MINCSYTNLGMIEQSYEFEKRRLPHNPIKLGYGFSFLHFEGNDLGLQAFDKHGLQSIPQASPKIPRHKSRLQSDLSHEWDEYKVNDDELFHSPYAYLFTFYPLIYICDLAIAVPRSL